MMMFPGGDQKIRAIRLLWLGLFVLTTPAMGQGDRPVQDAAAQAVAGLDEIRPYLTPPAGVVISARDGAVFIGKESGAPVPSGVTVKIVREKEPLIHPVTGEKIGAVTEPVGKILVTGDDGKIITAAQTGSIAQIKPGDRIESAAGKRKAVFFFDSKTESPAIAPMRSAAIERVSSFAEVGLVSPFAVERFIHDQNLAVGGTPRLAPESLKKMRESLSADFLILAGAEEKDGAVLIDVNLYDLASGVNMASFKGLAKSATAQKPAAPAEATAPVPAKPLEPLKAPLVSAEAPQAPKEQLKEGKQAQTAAPVTMKQLASFDERITALAVHDVDGDGAPEIIIGFDRKIAVHKTADGALAKPVWEKTLSARDQVVGVCAGDFDGDGRPEIYLNNIVDGSARSKIFRRDGSGFAEASAKLNMFFYAGADGRLYGQKQSPDLSMEDKLLALEWNGGRLSEKPFMPLPGGARISGIAVGDMDGDGASDVAGFDKAKTLIYHSSVKGDWARVDGEYGGSDIAMELPGQGEARVFHESQPAPVILKAKGKYARVFAPHNHPAASFFTSLLLYLKSQLHLLANEGMGYSQSFATPVTDGLIYATAYYGQADGGSVALASKTESSIFGPDKTELFMFTIGNE